MSSRHNNLKDFFFITHLFNEQIPQMLPNNAFNLFTVSANGDIVGDYEGLNGNGSMNSWNYHERVNMTVPDRIVVLGQDQHLGIYSVPFSLFIESIALI